MFTGLEIGEKNFKLLKEDVLYIFKSLCYCSGLTYCIRYYDTRCYLFIIKDRKRRSATLD